MPRQLTSREFASATAVAQLADLVQIEVVDLRAELLGRGGRPGLQTVPRELVHHVRFVANHGQVARYMRV